jgi:DNA-binding PadR family transcriptional regulator
VYCPAVRRKSGTGLVRNELKTLAAALKLAVDGQAKLYGYELFAQLGSWEGQPPMNHGTLYRCLRSLESKGFLKAEKDAGDKRPGPPRVYYELTATGLAEARRSTYALAAEVDALPWINPGDALPASLRPRQ